jgi:hypothetical protein
LFSDSCALFLMYPEEIENEGDIGADISRKRDSWSVALFGRRAVLRIALKAANPPRWGCGERTSLIGRSLFACRESLRCDRDAGDATVALFGGCEKLKREDVRFQFMRQYSMTLTASQ